MLTRPTPSLTRNDHRGWRARTAVLAVVAGMALTACGGGGDGPASRADAVATASTSLAAGDYDELGCGYLFAAVVTGQEALLLVETRSVEAPSPSTSEIGGDTWVASLWVGEDLAANWCDDVVEPGEPEAQIDVSYPVTGSLIWQADTTDCPGRASASLTGLRADVDGELVELPPLELENTAFGCFAG